MERLLDGIEFKKALEQMSKCAVKANPINDRIISGMHKGTPIHLTVEEIAILHEAKEASDRLYAVMSSHD